MGKLLLLIAAIGYISATPTCDDCKAAAAGLVARLTSKTSIEEQIGILVATLCPAAPDAAACEAGVTQWWSDIANCVYPNFLGSDDACVQLGFCTKRSWSEPKDWTCDECTNTIDRVAAYMQTQEVVDDAVAYLQENVSVVQEVTLMTVE